VKSDQRASRSMITVHVPMKFTTRGGRKIVLAAMAPAPSHPRADTALLKVVVRAHRWRRMIEAGKYASIAEVAKAEKVNQSYACRMLRLTLLAPAIVTNILDGGQNTCVILKDLLRPLPVQWDQQMATLKFSEPHSSMKKVRYRG
jgi:hypothetical protein